MEPPARVWFAHAIRGPACLLVVFTHLFDLFPNAQTLVAQIAHFKPVTGLPTVPWFGLLRFLAQHSISTGAVGVLLFFLVSGFVIPFSLEHRTLRGFFVRRLFRLYPTLWMCLLITVSVLVVQSHIQGTPLPFGKRIVGASALLVSPYLGLPWIEPVFWSLAVEELFYLIAAIVAWRGLLASRLVIVLLAAGLTATSMATGGASPGSATFWLGFHATFVIFILIGVVLHYLHRRRWGPVESLAIAAAIFVLYVVSIHRGALAPQAAVYLPSSIVALAVFGALFLVQARLPYSALLDRLSNISYPLYLLHGVNGYVVTRAMYVVTDNYYVAVATALAASVLLATVVHVLVETPTNNYGRRLSRRLKPRGRTAEAPSSLPA